MVYHKGAFWRITKTCQHCGKEFEVYPCRKNAKYCSQKCHFSDRKPLKRSSIPNVTKENLHSLYLEHKLSLRETAERLGVGWRTVLRWMKRYNIPRRNHLEAAKILAQRYLSKAIKSKELVNLYCNEGYTTREIAEKLGVCKSSVLNWMNQYDIPRMSYEEIQKRRSRASSEMWRKHRDEIVKKIIAGLHKRPTKPEKRLQEIIRQEQFPFVYSGNKKIVINGRCPDFIRNDGEEQIIEVFGVYWHSPLYKPTLKNPHRSEDAVLRDYGDVGYQCLIIWENEIEDKERVIQKIRSFVGD